MGYAIKVTTDLSPAEAESKVRESLVEQGFGIIMEIDLSGTLKAKIGKEMPPYKILGACRPPLASAAVDAEPDIGLLLPCNVVVYGSDAGTVVAAMDPDVLMSMADGETVAAVAADARERLERALAVFGDTM